ncbi:MAG: DUF1992 domain-containing protein [Deltaproteobacteria bacterium]|jgi:hypothetical protein|nr:DUF1992 domain-containing protein [Deltaproteobacteria bacterium]
MTLEFTSGILSVIADRKIEEAIKEGQFDNLPGKGREQILEDLSGLPEDLRLAYIVLKNSGYTQAAADEAVNIRSLLTGSPEEKGACKRLDKLKTRLRKPGNFDRLSESPYLDRILEKL